MSYTVQDLLELLDLESIEENIYRGLNRDIGTGRVFGGQVMAQALVAAQRTVPEERVAHSMHGYFILPGDMNAPIVYFVDRLRDGKSFTTRRVTAIQHGRAIFNMSASFQIVEDDGPEHQTEMPAAPPPESLVPDLELVRSRADSIPDHLRPILTQDRPIDFRPVDPIDPFDPVARPPRRMLWARVIGDMPRESLANQAVLAYASDYGLLATSLLPHALSIHTPGMQVATLDHAIWFHRPVHYDQWHLYVMDSPSASGARGFTRGSIFNEKGQLIASTAQEGLTRYHG
ncbi:MAG: acyl-CoA thioesterase II [Longimicrobiales bacterium]